MNKYDLKLFTYHSKPFLFIIYRHIIMTLSLFVALSQYALNVCCRYALENMPPLSLSPASNERPACLSLHVLGELESFLRTLAVYVLINFNTFTLFICKLDLSSLAL